MSVSSPFGLRVYSADNRKNFDNDYPQLIDALKSLTAKSATIDGEIAALDDQGRSSFQLLKSYYRLVPNDRGGFNIYDSQGYRGWMDENGYSDNQGTGFRHWAAPDGEVPEY